MQFTWQVIYIHINYVFFNVGSHRDKKTNDLLRDLRKLSSLMNVTLLRRCLSVRACLTTTLKHKRLAICCAKRRETWSKKPTELPCQDAGGSAIRNLDPRCNIPFFTYIYIKYIRTYCFLLSPFLFFLFLLFLCIPAG